MALPTSPATASPSSGSSTEKGKFLFPFIMVTSLFFFWGFIHNLEGVLIPHLRRSFNLNPIQASLVDSAVYLGYFLMAIPAGIIMKKYGYKTGILIGLSFFAIGCFLFVPAANTMQYALFLGALFIVACGLAILETAANPYVTVLGEPSKATQRLNFAQSFNGLAAFLAPTVGGALIFSEQPMSESALSQLSEQARNAYLLHETASVKLPYTILGAAIVVIAIIFLFTRLPDIKDAEEQKQSSFLSAWGHKHVRWAVIAQFFYVGAQACILTLMIMFAREAAGIAEADAKYYAGVAGLAFMLGRFAGTFFMRYIQPSKLLALYAVVCMVLCLVIIFGSGIITLYANIGIAFFMSIMFPTIFALGVKDIGADTKPASSLIIMAIVGGAALPPLLNWIFNATGRMQNGYIVPLTSFAVILYFGLRGYRHTEKAVEVLH